ncbi:MAG: hypothetical protein K0Q72_5398 [Armatimonadetes bacterium]|jgi:hypothetical protein|nr:hypothetical protein [Armatimonadota bacterium]MCE3245651.1 hypothetical protein [Arthrobacter sp.]
MELSALPAPVFAAFVVAAVLALTGLFRRNGVLLVLAGVLVVTAAGFAFSALALA